MNAIEALKYHTGSGPTKVQLDQANKYGGLNDTQTINSIPDQIETFATWWFEEYGVRVRDPYKSLASVVSIARWPSAQKQLKDKERVIPLIMRSLNVTKGYLDAVVVPPSNRMPRSVPVSSLTYARGEDLSGFSDDLLLKEVTSRGIEIPTNSKDIAVDFKTLPDRTLAEELKRRGHKRWRPLRFFLQ